MKKLVGLLALVLVGCGGGDAPTDTGPRGVSDDTILIGAHNDLSGALAIWGVPSTNGQRMRYAEANAAGGVHGRTIEYLVEDSQYQMPLAIKAANKLLNVDDIFIMSGAMGTPMNIALMPQMFEVDVPSVFPLTAAVQMHEPLHPMKFNFFVSYRDQIRGGMQYIVGKHGYNKVCLQTVANDYGHENEIGFDMAVEELGLEVVYRGTHKGTETDFVGTVAAIKNSGCEMLVLGTLIKDTILLYTSARDAGFDAPVVSNMVSYVPEIAAGADGGMDGLYASASFYVPDFDAEIEAGTWAGQWAQRYIDTYGEHPAPQAVIGYLSADLVVKALEAAGPDLTIDKFLTGLESISAYEDPFGGPTMTLSPTKHQAGDFLNFYEVEDSKWVVVERNLPY